MTNQSTITPTQTQHIDAVMLEDGSARLTVTTVSTSAQLVIPEASGLAEDIEAVFDPATTEAVRATYTCLPADNGAEVRSGNGAFHVPWRFITTVVDQLRS